MYVYILTDSSRTKLYIGTTNDIERRIVEHKNHVNKNSYSSKYKTTRLVHLEEYPDAYSGIRREKNLKKWNRSWKIDLIELDNPNWKDLAKDFDC